MASHRFNMPRPCRGLAGIVLAGCCWVSAAGSPGHTGEAPAPAGSPPSVVVVEFSDFACRPCARVGGVLQELANTGKIALQVVFKHAPLAHPEDLWLHEASLAAGELGRFWELHDWLFQHPGSSSAAVYEEAARLGLPVDAIRNATETGRHRDRVIQDMIEAQGLGVRILPTLFVNGTKLEGLEQIEAWTQAALAQLALPRGADVVDMAEFDLAGSPTQGPEDAPITIVEFSDFQCGFCTANSRTLQELMARYPGRIRRVFKHYPSHQGSEGVRPHLAAAAAWNQGRFWDTEALLREFPPTDETALRSYAESAGLMVPQFMADLARPENRALIERDCAEGERLMIYSTPTMFLNGRRLTGRQSTEELATIVDGILSEKHAANQPAQPDA